MKKIVKQLAAIGSAKAVKNALPAIRRAGHAVCREIKDPLIVRKKLVMTDTVYRKKEPKKPLCTCEVDMDIEFRLLCAAGCALLIMLLIALIRRLIRMKKSRAEHKKLRAERRRMKSERRLLKKHAE